MQLFNIALTIAATALTLWALLKKKPTEAAGRSIRAEAAFDRLHYLLLAVVIAVGLFVRIYKLDALPYGIHVDEAGAAYDGWALANFGVDRYLNHYPVYLLNYGTGQSALLAYILSLSFRLFGVGIWSIRVPMALICGSTILTGYLLVRKTAGKCLALLTAFLISVTPFFVMSSRYALDCTLLYPLFTASMWLFARAVNRQKIWLFALAGLLFGLTLYSYVLSYIILPLFLLFAVAYLIAIRKIGVRQLVAFGMPLLLFAVPLMLMLAVNNGIIAPISTSLFTVPKLTAYRGAEISPAHIVDSLKYLPTVFSFESHSYYSFENYFVLYMVSLPFLLLGLVRSVSDTVRAIKERRFSVHAFAVAAFLAVMILLLMLELPTIYKANAIFPALAIFTAAGVGDVAKKVRGAAIPILAAYCVCFVGLSLHYFTVDTGTEHQMFHKELPDTYAVTRKAFPDSVVTVHVGGSSATYDWSYIYPLLIDLTSPYEFNETRYEWDGAVNYGKNRFYLPIAVDEAGDVHYDITDGEVYIISAAGAGETISALMAELESRGFTYFENGRFRVYHKP